jgi:hypothetical protein
MSSIKSTISHRWIVVDNGSDIVPPHPKTSVFVEKNNQVMSGALAGLDAITADFFWDFSTSMSGFRYDSDPIEDMLSAFKDENVVSVSPAFRAGAKAPTHKIYNQRPEHFHQIPIGGFDGMWRTQWLKDHLDHRFTSWGHDIDLGFQAHTEGKIILVDNYVTCEIVERKGYPERRRVSEEENNRVENERMNSILSEKYGADWRSTEWLAEVLK